MCHGVSWGREKMELCASVKKEPPARRWDGLDETGLGGTRPAVPRRARPAPTRKDDEDEGPAVTVMPEQPRPAPPGEAPRRERAKRRQITNYHRARTTKRQAAPEGRGARDP